MLFSIHPETPDEILTVSNSERRHFSPWQENLNIDTARVEKGTFRMEFRTRLLRIGEPHYRLKMRDYISSRSSFLWLDSSEAKRFRSSVKSKATVSSALAGRLAATLLMQKWDLPKLMIFYMPV